MYTYDRVYIERVRVQTMKLSLINDELFIVYNSQALFAATVSRTPSFFCSGITILVVTLNEEREMRERREGDEREKRGR